MVLLERSIVLVALPSIGPDLGFADADLEWVMSAYALTFGGLLLLGGRCADLLGCRRLLMVGGPGVGAVFVAGSIATLAGVSKEVSGLASGLNNTSFQIGTALGVAVVSTVAVSQTTAGGSLVAQAPDEYEEG